MAAKDITSLRPWYLSATMLRDFHYTVFNAEGAVVLVLVTDVGQKRSYFVKEPLPTLHRVVYENQVETARYCLAAYSRDSTDLLDTLKHYHYEPGLYGFSVVDAVGERLYTFEFTLT